MGRRLQLHSLLKDILGTDHVYFQPPPSVSMKYPCIVYERDYFDIRFANDKPYNRQPRYKVTVIDQNPDGNLPEKVGALPMCTFDRRYASENLNHDVFKIYY